MLPEEAWIILKMMLGDVNKQMKLESHLAFLKTCMEENMIPKGLRYQCKITFDDINLKRKCQARLNRASFKTMRLCISWIYREINEITKYLKIQKSKMVSLISREMYRDEMKKLNGD